MDDQRVTVEALARLIAGREELRAELQALAKQAREQWQEIQAKLSALEDRIDHPDEHISGVWVAATKEAPAAIRDLLTKVTSKAP
jgi:BMFP domain-containing protein YqiC